jgi:hypothetical protein
VTIENPWTVELNIKRSIPTSNSSPRKLHSIPNIKHHNWFPHLPRRSLHHLFYRSRISIQCTPESSPHSSSLSLSIMGLRKRTLPLRGRWRFATAVTSHVVQVAAKAFSSREQNRLTTAPTPRSVCAATWISMIRTVFAATSARKIRAVSAATGTRSIAEANVA